MNTLLAPADFDWKIQQERGARARANGYVYVPIGGRAGDWFAATLSFTDTAASSPQAVPLGGMGALDNQAHLYTLDGWAGSTTTGRLLRWRVGVLALLEHLLPDSLGGYVLDGWGGLHPFGNAPAISNFSYWPNWDIARLLVLAVWSSHTNPAGWTLDGWGGIHPFGSAPAIAGFAYWPN
ncbi:MAG: hypothetical protein ACYDAL_18685 [Candidatus Dormibacteraceae bacterium]